METTPAGDRRQRAEFLPALERHSGKVQADFSIGHAPGRSRSGASSSRSSAALRKWLIALADQDLIAGFADSRSIALQAVENADDVVVIVFDQLLAEAHDVGTARSALARIALALSRHTIVTVVNMSAAATAIVRNMIHASLRKIRRGIPCHSWIWIHTPVQRPHGTFAGCEAIGHRMRPCAGLPPGDKSRPWAVSSVGRASALHAEGQRFESVTAHQPSLSARSSAWQARLNLVAQGTKAGAPACTATKAAYGFASVR